MNTNVNNMLFSVCLKMILHDLLIFHIRRPPFLDLE